MRVSLREADILFAGKTDEEGDMASTAQKRKEQKNLEIKNKVFGVATKLIEEMGYESVTVREICAAAGISTGMFYRHFTSKEDLLSFYYDKAVEEFYGGVAEKLEGLPLEEQLVRFEVWLGRFTQGCGLDFNRSLYVSTNKIMNTELVHNRMIEITDGIIERAVSAGYVLSEGRTPHAISRDLCIISKGVIFDWCAHDGNYDLGERIDELLRRIIGSLL
jgi:AcrR family transcriptional regulator